jgi:hypothetical protein
MSPRSSGDKQRRPRAGDLGPTAMTDRAGEMSKTFRLSRLD